MKNDYVERFEIGDIIKNKPGKYSIFPDNSQFEVIGTNFGANSQLVGLKPLQFIDDNTRRIIENINIYGFRSCNFEFVSSKNTPKKEKFYQFDDEMYLIIDSTLNILDSTDDFGKAKEMASDESFNSENEIFVYKKVARAKVSVSFEEIE